MRRGAKSACDSSPPCPKGYEPPDEVLVAAGRDAVRAGGTRRARHRPRGRAAARRCSTPTSGRAWARRTSTSGGCATSSPTASTRRSSRRARDGRHRHALPPGARRRGDHRGRAHGTARPRGTRPRTACTRRRPCSPASSGSAATMNGSSSRSRCARRSTRCRRTSRPRSRTSPWWSRTSTRRIPTCSASSTASRCTEGGPEAPGEPEHDLDLPPAARGGLSRSRRAAGGDPHHGAPRARPLLRNGRGPARRAWLRVTLALQLISVAAAVVAALVLVAFAVRVARGDD